MQLLDSIVEPIQEHSQPLADAVPHNDNIRYTKLQTITAILRDCKFPSKILQLTNKLFQPLIALLSNNKNSSTGVENRRVLQHHEVTYIGCLERVVMILERSGTIGEIAAPYLTTDVNFSGLVAIMTCMFELTKNITVTLDQTNATGT